MAKPKTVPELQRNLEEAGIPGYYSFREDGQSDCFHLVEFHEELGRGWHYYYSERGRRRDALTFRDESEACEWFADHVLRVPHRRMTWPRVQADLHRVDLRVP